MNEATEMITDPIPEDDLRYNAATACFEACVTVHSAGPARRYACAVPADLTLTNAEAEAALRADALRRHETRRGLSASVLSAEPVPLRPKAAPHRGWRAHFGFLNAA